MSRPFTERERRGIRKALLDTGRELFVGRGIRATTVEQIARGAGISKGAFYLFFPSKEALLLALVEEIETELHERLEAQVVAEPREAVRLLLRYALTARDMHPLAGLALSEEVIGVLRTMTPDEREAFLDRDVGMVSRIVEQLAAQGVMVVVDPLVLAGLLRALFFIGVHADDIGTDVAPRVEDVLVESLARTLIEPAVDAR